MAAVPPRHPSSLALGTVQFGVAYGVSNTSGKVSSERAADILALAQAEGIGWLDTAAAYGDSEAVLGGLLRAQPAFRVVTKTARLADVGVQGVVERVRESARTLGRIDALLVHAAADLLMPQGHALWEALADLREKGLVTALGFSAYVEDGPLQLAQGLKPDIVQLAASVFDQRLIRGAQIGALADLGVSVHVRSAFLQGLAFMAPGDLPPRLAAAAPLLKQWRQTLDAVGVSPARACLDFLLSVPGVDKIVVGVTRPEELAELASAVRGDPLGLDYGGMAADDPVVLDPRQW